MDTELEQEPEKPTEQRTTLWVSKWTHSQVLQAKALMDETGAATTDDVVREAMDSWLSEQAS